MRPLHEAGACIIEFAYNHGVHGIILTHIMHIGLNTRSRVIIVHAMHGFVLFLAMYIGGAPSSRVIILDLKAYMLLHFTYHYHIHKGLISCRLCLNA